MTKLIAVGYWNDKPFEERFIYPQEVVSEKKLPDMLKLADYVAKGNSAIAWKGYSACRICDKILGTRCLTDGAYIWPEKLEHYIVEHDIFLPQEFIDHAKNNKWQVKKTDYNGSYHGEIDRSFWINWCEKHRNKSLQPNFTYKQYSIPKKTGKGKLTPEILSEAFHTIEDLDCIVDFIEMDDREIPLNILDKHNGKEYCWSAEIHRGFPLITVVGRDHVAYSSIVFQNKKPIIYCEQEASMYGKYDVETRYCPDLDLRNENEHK